MTTSERFVQCRFSDGNSRLVAFVANRPGLRVGAKVRLRDSDDPDRWWTVTDVSQPVGREAIKRGWNNNI